MKKTHSITIGGSMFHVEEDAYEKLETYLSSVKKHFEGNTDHEEILRDIEGRIAERFSEKHGGVVTLADVESVIVDMGTVEQFDGAEGAPENTSSGDERKLYRDTDDVVIAGVCSGLGYYFKVDPLVFRCIFIALVVGGGAGVIIYGILWLLVPTAKTAAEKSAMRGSKVTLSAVAGMVREKIDEIKTPKHRHMLRKILSIPVAIVGAIVPAVRVLVGAVILLASFMFAVGATVALGTVLFAVSSTFIDGPMLPIAQSTSSHVLAIALYLAVLVPALFGVICGIRLISKKRVLSRSVTIPLVCLWMVAVLGAAILGSRVFIQVTEKIASDPYYKTETRTLPLESFTKIALDNNQSVRIIPGKESKVTLKARAQDMDSLEVVVIDGELSLKQKEELRRACLFCRHSRVDIEIAAPAIDTIALNNNSHIYGTLDGDTVDLSLNNNSYADLQFATTRANVTLNNNAHAHLTGASVNLNTELQNNSYLDALSLETINTTIKASNNSSADIYVMKHLTLSATNGSHVMYMGMPTIEQHIDSSSAIDISETP